jgi:competence protein ComEA
VNINSATADELVRIPGIGPARAAAIVTLRERAHRFNHPEDLLRVRGIGRVGFRRMRPYLALAGETTLASRPGRAPRVRPEAMTE